MQQSKVYEIYSRQLSDESLMGFVEIEELLFGEPSALVLDPNDEKLRTEFQGVRRSYIPMHTILRIDEVRGYGDAKIRATIDKNDNISHFPVQGQFQKRDQQRRDE